MTTLRKSSLFGKSIGFPPRIGADGRMAWSEGEENIRESIRIILLTELRERIMLPEFGAGLGRYLFEPNTVTTRHLIQDRMQKALKAWEPRLAVESLTVEADPIDPQAAIATITYRLVATQAVERMSLSLTLAS